MAEWFEDWFDTKYYHILYKDRDFSEAETFLSSLLRQVNLPPEAKILDLACGKGRHSIYLNSLGFDVVGADLSAASIAEAKQHESDKLSFVQHDMRKALRSVKFNAVFNLFTSFGYFSNEADNNAVLKAIHSDLLENGLLLIDFFNVQKVVQELVPEEILEIEGIKFTINKTLEEGFVKKDISFEDQGISYKFQESVQALNLNTFTNMLAKNNFKILDVFGDYKLANFDLQKSNRLIILAKRT